MHTVRFYHESRMKRSIAASGTFSGQHIRGKRRHRRYHLVEEKSFSRCIAFERILIGDFSHKDNNGANVRIAADSTMLRMVNLFIALSFGVHLEQFEHLIGLTCPRPFLFRPLQVY